MADTLANETPAKVKPVVKRSSSSVGSEIRRQIVSFAIAGQAIADRLMLPTIPKGARGVRHRIQSSLALGGVATIAIGIAGNTGKYRAAAILNVTTAEDVSSAANVAAVLAADENPFITVAAAALPDRPRRRSFRSRRSTPAHKTCRRGLGPPAVRGGPAWFKSRGGGRPPFRVHPGGRGAMLLTYVPIANLALRAYRRRRSDRRSQRRQPRRPDVKAAWEATRLIRLATPIGASPLAPSRSPQRPMIRLAARARPHAFPLPPDMVSLVEIVDPELERRRRRVRDRARPQRRRAAGRGRGPITIRYVRDPDMPGSARWSPGFAEAFAFRSPGRSPIRCRPTRAARTAPTPPIRARAAHGAQATRTKPFAATARRDWTRARQWRTPRAG
jgi:hypothetical protein